MVGFFTSKDLPDNITSKGSFFVIEVPSTTTFRIARFREDLALAPTGTNTGPHTVNRAVSDLVARGGTVENPYCVREGLDDLSNKAALFTCAIAIPNSRILGTHPNGTGSGPYVKGVNPKGYFIGPHTAVGRPGIGFGGVDIRNGATGTVIDGFRFAAPPDPGNAFTSRITNEGGSMKVRNCVYDAAIVGGGTIINEGGNMTNAAWLAAHKPNDG